MTHRKTADTLDILELREIEAEVLKPIYKEMVSRFGEKAARATIETAIRRKAIADGRRMGSTDGDRRDLTTFLALMSRWTAGNALEIDILEQGADRLDFNVTTCRYAEMYRRLGLGDIGHLLSCNRDGAFCEGYDPRMRLTRTQTIMSGASHCDFRYRLDTDE